MQYRYQKIEIDNPICNRRFHIAYEEREGAPLAHRTVKCPHCGVTVFEADQFPEVILTREENLVKSPDGSRPIINTCAFLKDDQGQK
jgi:hypothetical protein